MGDTTLRDGLDAGLVAGGGLLIALLFVALVILVFAVPLSGILWWMGVIEMEVVVATLVVAVTISMLFGGGQ